ncbi:MAG: glycosyltransferase family 2 protein [Anaerolineaceae bacterium]|nr:glycosyltransferase family 2 protein [Anaerolineaceae bacterium]
MPHELECSIVIPVFNSALSLRYLIGELDSFLQEFTDNFEIILVNDGSRDNSWEVITEICGDNQRIRAFDLARNFGQHNALLCGIRQANYEVIITMDDDLQHSPSDIPQLIKEIESGLDLVYATPKHENHSLWRKFSSSLVKWALKISVNVPYAEKISAFRAFRTVLRDNFSNYNNSYVSIDVLLSWGTTKIGFLEIEHHQRKIGKSQYSFYKLMRHAANMIFGFSVLPLRVASVLGFIFTIFGFIILAYVLIRYLIQGGAVPGFSFLASTIAIFSGMILFVLGIVGEYLARIYTNVMTKPQYLVTKSIGGKLV